MIKKLKTMLVLVGTKLQKNLKINSKFYINILSSI